ncbi:MAG: helix-turn-helix domain-containing protein [Kiritimatiellales bacterium]
MNGTVTNEQIIQAVFSATDEAKECALEVLEGRANSPSEPQDNDALLLSMGEAAELLNISRATLWRTLKSGRLTKVELYPGAYRLRRADVVALAAGKAVRRG